MSVNRKLRFPPYVAVRLRISEAHRRLPNPVVNDKGRYHSHLVCLAAMRTLPLRSDSGKLDWIPFGRITPRSERDVSSKADSWREQPIAPASYRASRACSTWEGTSNYLLTCPLPARY